MLTNDNIFLIFIGILVSDIIYQTGLLQKMSIKLEKISIRLKTVEDKIKQL